MSTYCTVLLYTSTNLPQDFSDTILYYHCTTAFVKTNKKNNGHLKNGLPDKDF